MPRQKKDAKILNIKLAKEISDQLEQFCRRIRNSLKLIATEKILLEVILLGSNLLKRRTGNGKEDGRPTFYLTKVKVT